MNLFVLASFHALSLFICLKGNSSKIVLAVTARSFHSLGTVYKPLIDFIGASSLGFG